MDNKKLQRKVRVASLISLALAIVMGNNISTREEIINEYNRNRPNEQSIDVSFDRNIKSIDEKIEALQTKRISTMNDNTHKEEVVEEKCTSNLQGKVICIDAGHQRKGNNAQESIAPSSRKTKAKVSSGTKGIATGKYEYELNLEVALQLQQALLEKQVIVHMVRETHDVDISNVQRAQLANDVGADLSLRIHADSSSSMGTNGFSILIPGTEYVNKDIVTKSREIAEQLEKALSAGIENKSRGITTRNDLTGFNWCNTPVVLIEMGFMSNPEEDKRMSTESFQKDIVKAIIVGLESYYE